MVKVWQDQNILTVKRNRVPSSKKSASGTPLGVSKLCSITGRRYTFYEDESSYGVSFSPTAIKNYPVQGLATADIVPMILGKLFKFIYNNSLQHKVLLINTIHDSVLFDIQDKETLDEVAPMIKELMQDAPLFFKQTFGVNFTLPLNVDMKYGKNWQEMEPYDCT